MKYKFSKGLKKGVIAVFAMAIPFFITNFPDLANLTIGGLLLMLLNWLKIRHGMKI